MKCKQHGFKCTALRCEAYPCRKNEPEYEPGDACPRCGEVQLAYDTGPESTLLHCTRCNWSVTYFTSVNSVQKRNKRG